MFNSSKLQATLDIMTKIEGYLKLNKYKVNENLQIEKDDMNIINNLIKQNLQNEYKENIDQNIYYLLESYETKKPDQLQQFILLIPYIIILKHLNNQDNAYNYSETFINISINKIDNIINKL